MILHTILCEICDEPIAKAHLPELARPLVASMFNSMGEGFDNPFLEGQTWEWMKCPLCRNRPFIVTERQASAASSGKWPGPEVVKTHKGPYRIYDNVYPGVLQERSAEVYTEARLEREWRARIDQYKAKVEVEETPKKRGPGRPRKKKAA